MANRNSKGVDAGMALGAEAPQLLSAENTCGLLLGSVTMHGCLLYQDVKMLAVASQTYAEEMPSFVGG